MSGTKNVHWQKQKGSVKNEDYVGHTALKTTQDFQQVEVRHSGKKQLYE
jgi:hypothetical protein